MQPYPIYPILPTTLVEHLILDYLRKGKGFILVDQTGIVSDQMLGFFRVEFKDQLVYIDLSYEERYP